MHVRSLNQRAGLFVLAFVLAAAAAAPVFADRVVSIGLIDYSRKNFKVGDWVRYRVEVASSNGNEAVNFQEVRIVGEEMFRGEPCTWVETWFGPDSADAVYNLTLISNEGFKDPQADVRFSVYLRLLMTGEDNEGRPEFVETRRANDANPFPDMSKYRGEVDTLGTETVQTPKGAIEARMVTLHRKFQNPRDRPDSTINRITDIKRKVWRSRRIPITSQVKSEETEDWLVQAYKVGEVSKNAPEVLFSSETRKATVVAWGSGAKSTRLALWHEKKAEIGKMPEAAPSQ